MNNLGYSVAVYNTASEKWELYGYDASTTQKTTDKSLYSRASETFEHCRYICYTSVEMREKRLQSLNNRMTFSQYKKLNNLK